MGERGDTSTTAFERVRQMIDDTNKNLYLDFTPDCCIYPIPETLRKVNESAYEPQLISIGPFHNEKEAYDTKDHKKSLSFMKGQKIRYMINFRKRIASNDGKWGEMIRFTLENQCNILKCYQGFYFENDEHVVMILYDAIFIIELFLRFHEKEPDFLLDRTSLLHILKIDLLLPENQLPYFFLEDLYNIAFPGLGVPLFMDLAFSFFRDFMFNGVPPAREVKHFTDMIRSDLIWGIPHGFPPEENRQQIEVFPCAMKLYESGLKFECHHDKGLLQVDFPDQGYTKTSRLQMSKLGVNYHTETILRNVMALEQCHYPKDALVCNYAELMDHLIDTEKDVELLVKNGIISNHFGDNASVANMFNKLCFQHPSRTSCYSFVSEQLRRHYDSHFNRSKTTLIHGYFRNPWRSTATFAAFILLLLTGLQTYLSYLQVRKK